MNDVFGYTAMRQRLWLLLQSFEMWGEWGRRDVSSRGKVQWVRDEFKESKKLGARKAKREKMPPPISDILLSRFPPLLLLLFEHTIHMKERETTS